MEEFKKASCIRGFHVYQDNFIPILGERLVRKNELQQVIQEIDMLSQFVKWEMRYVQWGIFLEIFQPCVRFLFGAVELFTGRFKGAKNLLEKFCDWTLIHENRESFPLQTICIIQYTYVATFT